MMVLADTYMLPLAKIEAEPASRNPLPSDLDFAIRVVARCKADNIKVVVAWSNHKVRAFYERSPHYARFANAPDRKSIIGFYDKTTQEQMLADDIGEFFA